ncbi:hypothetical protein ARMSODRAFT_975557 [Armillaria solidipes]|uniref:Uncharacterized protein n=1 Tax=Armillaria solidipes TaxID=1076256 RepID=A0A2H3BVR5_9AGAR|nr:hypothetical protein ARMSODRAFT_975557 [Armillaria solidipes]
MAQNEPNSTKWRDVATTIATSTSPGTAANTVALAVVLWYSLPNIFPPLRSSSAITLLENAIKELADMYGEHKSILGDRASFATDLNKLQLAALELKEKHIQTSLNISWMSLPSRLSDEKYVWGIARERRREVVALKSRLELAIIEAKKGSLQAVLENQGAVDGLRGDRGIRLTNDASAHMMNMPAIKMIDKQDHCIPRRSFYDVVEARSSHKWSPEEKAARRAPVPTFVSHFSSPAYVTADERNSLKLAKTDRSLGCAGGLKKHAAADHAPIERSAQLRKDAISPGIVDLSWWAPSESKGRMAVAMTENVAEDHTQSFALSVNGGGQQRRRLLWWEGLGGGAVVLFCWGLLETAERRSTPADDEGADASLGRPWYSTVKWSQWCRAAKACCTIYTCIDEPLYNVASLEELIPFVRGNASRRTEMLPFAAR